LQTFSVSSKLLGEENPLSLYSSVIRWWIWGVVTSLYTQLTICSLHFNHTSSLTRFRWANAYSANKKEIMTKALKTLTDYVDMT
jgi:hypothetical protein